MTKLQKLSCDFSAVGIIYIPELTKKRIDGNSWQSLSNFVFLLWFENTWLLAWFSWFVIENNESRAEIRRENCHLVSLSILNVCRPDHFRCTYIIIELSSVLESQTYINIILKFLCIQCYQQLLHYCKKTLLHMCAAQNVFQKTVKKSFLH